MSYLPCELHCHTKHSDGDFTVEELQRAAIDDHLALIALTDHNTSSGCAQIDETIIPTLGGIEWTTYFGHMLVLGAREFVDWRDAVPDNIDEKIKQVKAVGGIVGIAHPFQMGSPVCSGGRWEFNIKDFNNVDYIEIWHQDFSPSNRENEQAVQMWSELLDKGYKIAATYGKDWHRPTPPDKHYGCTYLDFPLKTDGAAAIRAIRMGRTVVSTGAKMIFKVHKHGRAFDIGDSIPKGRVVFDFYTDLHSRQKNSGDENIEYTLIKIITNSSQVVAQTGIDQQYVTINAKRGNWYRAELWGKVNNQEKVLAITSPVYCEL